VLVNAIVHRQQRSVADYNSPFLGAEFLFGVGKAKTPEQACDKYGVSCRAVRTISAALQLSRWRINDGLAPLLMIIVCHMYRTRV
jgi:hypothetical protein